MIVPGSARTVVLFEFVFRVTCRAIKVGLWSSVGYESLHASLGRYRLASMLCESLPLYKNLQLVKVVLSILMAVLVAFYGLLFTASAFVIHFLAAVFSASSWKTSILTIFLFASYFVICFENSSLIGFVFTVPSFIACVVANLTGRACHSSVRKLISLVRER
jgi:ABC-type proline/glycine betaine transport system permease subunit